MTSTESLKLSVVVPTFRRDEPLVRTIDQIRGQLRPNDELLVVDQVPAHDSATADYLTAMEADDRLKWIRLAEASLPLARNVGAGSATGDIVLYLDDDVDLDDGLFAKHATYYADPRIGGVAGHVVQDGRPRYRPTGAYAKAPSGCHQSFRRRVILETGGFDEPLIGSYWCEEKIFAERVRRAGWLIANGSDCVCVHRPELTEPALNLHGRRTDEWYHAAWHNWFYWYLTKPLSEKVLGLPFHARFILRYARPPMRDLLTPRFLRAVLMRACADAVRSSRLPQSRSFDSLDPRTLVAADRA